MTSIFGISGISGRMGQELSAALQAEGAAIIGLTRTPPAIECAIRYTDHVKQFVATADVIIDFSRPKTCLSLLADAIATATPLVSGTTGFSAEEFAELQKAAAHIPLLWDSNMSLGVNLLMRLVKQAAAVLPADYDIEIFEMHHRHKTDAPSGTALSLGEAAAEARQLDWPAAAALNREGSRVTNSIGFAALRGGSVIGDHKVIFAGMDDQITLSHRAHNRSIYAKGAIEAAKRLKDKPAGFYRMADMIGG